MMNQYPFFVYGTLLPGQPNHVLWEQAITHLQPASLSGTTLFDLDWYPMLVDWPGDVVEGLLVTVRPESYAPVLARLDFLEGFDPTDPVKIEYRREKRLVNLSGGQPVIAWVYVGGRQLVVGRPQLQTNWIAHLSHSRRSVNEWWRMVRSVGRDSSQFR